MRLNERVQFFRSYLNDPAVVGAVAPSSARLAEALTRPLAECRRATRVLEVGAGIGTVTERIARLLRPDDHFDICEVKDDFADRIEFSLLSKPGLQQARAAGRIRLLRCPAEDLNDAQGYEFIISGLPFTSFQPALVEAVLASIRLNLRPGGVFSYFEYIGLRKLNRALSVGRARQRVRAVSALLDRHIHRHQISRETVLLNVPPAHARHWCFEPGEFSPPPLERVGRPFGTGAIRG